MRVAVLDADAMLCASVARSLEGMGMTVAQLSRPESLGDVASPDVLLVDSLFVEIVDTLSEAPRVVLVMVSYPDPGLERDLARRYGILRKPFTGAELWALLEDELGEAPIRPSLLLHALREAHSQRRSVRLIVSDTEDVHVVDGEIHDARAPGLRGERALRALLERPRRVREGPGSVVTRTVLRPFHRVLFSLLAEIDDAERGRALGVPS